MWFSSLFRKKTCELGVENIDIFSTEFKQSYYEFYPKLYPLGDFIFFKKSNCFGVFNYNTVKSVLSNSTDFSAKVNSSFDPVLLGIDGEKHLYKKRHVHKALYTISENEKINKHQFLDLVFEKLICHASSQPSFNVIEEVINPFVLSSLFYEFGFERIPENLNILDNDVDVVSLCSDVNLIFQNISNLDQTINENLRLDIISDVSEHIVKMLKEDDEDQNNFFKFLFYSGIETTSSLISSSLFQLYSDISVRRKMQENADYTIILLNEILRLFSPAQFTFRVTTKPMYSNGQLIPDGSKIAVSIGAANRDPAVFANPTEFNDQRTHSHVAFGFGKHKCIGEKLSINVASELIERFKPFVENFKVISSPIYANSFVLQMKKLELRKK